MTSEPDEQNWFSMSLSAENWTELKREFDARGIECVVITPGEPQFRDEPTVLFIKGDDRGDHERPVNVTVKVGTPAWDELKRELDEAGQHQYESVIKGEADRA
jgi:hypothetical protein